MHYEQGMNLKIKGKINKKIENSDLQEVET